MARTWPASVLRPSSSIPAGFPDGTAFGSRRWLVARRGLPGSRPVIPRGRQLGGPPGTRRGRSRRPLGRGGLPKDHGAARVGVLAEGDWLWRRPWPAVSGQHAFDALAVVGPTNHWGDKIDQEPWWQSPRSYPGRLYWCVMAGVRLKAGSGPELAELLPKAAAAPCF